MINFDNSVTNIANTPGIISAPTSEAPVASTLAPGTIYINTTTGAISQSNGSTFNTIGGGGSTPGIDSVLAVNQFLSQNRNIRLNNFALRFVNGLDNLFQFQVDNSFLKTGQSGASIRLINTLGTHQILTAFQKGNTPDVLMGLSIIKTGATQPIQINIGDYGNQYNGTQIELDDNAKTIKTYNAAGQISGFLINQSSNVFNFGNELDFFSSDNTELVTYTNAIKYGLRVFNNQLTQLGDYNNAGGFYINVNTGLSEIFMNAPGGQIFMQTDLISMNGALTTGSSSGSSGQHLQITINGSTYVIALLNP